MQGSKLGPKAQTFFEEAHLALDCNNFHCTLKLYWTNLQKEIARGVLLTNI